MFIERQIHKKVRINIENLQKLAKVAGVSKSAVIGKNLTPNFTDYIWGGDIIR